MRAKTPIRWLCLRTFAYFGLSESRELDSEELDMLCRAVDLGAYLNRCFDGKGPFDPAEYRQVRQGLPGEPTRLYLRQLRELEYGRPDRHDWPEVLHYRREVTWVSLCYLFSLVDLRSRPVLLDLCSLIQLADDLLDQRVDQRLGLPSLVTAAAPRPSLLASSFWRELRSHPAREEWPVVVCGGFVYLMVLLLALCSRSLK